VIDLCRNEPLTLWGLFSFFTCELGLPLKAESPTNVRSVGLTHRRISVVGSNHKGQLLKRYEIKMETVCQASVNKMSKTCTIQPF
jgi:hypothetical protein